MLPRNVRILSLVNLFTGLRFFAAIQIIYFAQVTGSYALAMSVFSVSALFQSLLEIPTGIFSDTIDRRKTTILCAFSGFLSVTLFAIGHMYLFLFLGAIIEGLARALGSGNNDALLHDTLKDSKEEDLFYKYLGKIGSYQATGFGIAALSGGFIATFSFPTVMWLSVFTQFMAFLSTLFLQEPHSYTKSELNPYAHLKESITAFKNNPKLRLLTMSKAIKESLSESSYQFSAAFIATLWPIWAIGLKNTVDSFLSIYSYSISEKFIKRFGELKSLTFQFIYYRVVSIIAYMFPSVLSPILLASTSAGSGISDVAEKSLMQKEFTDKQRATMGSLDSIVVNIGFVFGSFGIGYLADIVGPAKTLLTANILLLSVLFLYRKMFKHEKSTIKL
ncbi:MFS transporter [Candidatus Woesebacteria bacterium]|nr:MFS transporter [Candidatus Woesebacteria bacterium]